MKPTQLTTTTPTKPTPASREALHALGNGIDQIRWKLADLLRGTNWQDLPQNVLKYFATAQFALKAAADELVNEYHKEARDDD